MNPTMLLELLDRLTRSWWTIVAGACLGLAGAIAALNYLPKTFEATTTVLVVPPQIPENMQRNMVTDDMSMRLRALREAILSRPYMLQLIEDVYGEIEDPQRLDNMIRSIQGRLQITLLRIDQREGGGVFSLAYRDGDAERAARVVNRSAQLYIEQNIQFRTTQAQGAARTFESLLASVERELNAVQDEIATFKEQHLYETPDHATANQSLLQTAQTELSSVEAELQRARDRLEGLRGQADQAEWLQQAVPGAPESADPLVRRLAELQEDLKNLRARYSEDHPSVAAKKRELDALLRESGAASGAAGTESVAGSPPATLSPLQAQIASTERDIARIEDQRDGVLRRISEYRRRIESTPAVAQKLDELETRRTGLRRSYDEYQSKLEDAKASKTIEAAQQGERFEVIEEAVAPIRPIRPVPAVIYAVGFAGGLIAFVGPMLLRGILVPMVSSEAGLRAITDIPFLGSIPQLHTPSTLRAARMRLLGNISASVASVVILAGTAYWFIIATG